MSKQGGVGAALALCALAFGVEAQAPERATTESLVPKTEKGKVELGKQYDAAWDLYQALKAKAGGGKPLAPDETMPDWTGLWTRVGPPRFDSGQKANQLTTAKLKPIVRAELSERRKLAEQGIEYDPITDCSPPGFPRWLAIPFLREFIVTPKETWLFSETVNNMRRVYTDGRGHAPKEDAYPLWYGDSIGFWSNGRLVIHTSQLRANIFHRPDQWHSDQIQTVEVWHKVDDNTIMVDFWAYDSETLLEPWYVRQTFEKVDDQNGTLRIRYWNCFENSNNEVVKTKSGSSTFSDFSFTRKK